jgi:cardiolipin synthase
MNSRNHAKICIIDRKIVFVGSANITCHLQNSNDEKKWRETCIKLEGVDTRVIQDAFDRLLRPALFRHFYSLKKYIADPVFILNYSRRLRRYIWCMFLHKIKNCKERIWIANAYFVPDIYLLKQLINASKRGIDVRILLTEKSDVLFVPIASSMFYATLLKHGIKIYEYEPSMLHEKILILDDFYSIGSGNLNYRSFKHDLEVNVSLQTDSAKSVLRKSYLHDLESARLVKLEDIKQQSLYKKVIGYMVLLLKYYI